MATPPSQPDFLSAANILLGDNAPPAKFLAPNLPANTGLGTRQSLIQNERPATSGRKLIRWLIPDGPIVEMYINPQGISYDNNKSISQVRTKGGYNFQYWGPELVKLNITGTTGTSGIEGINVLEDVYNAEQLAFDPYALYLASKVQQETFSSGLFGDSALSAGDQFVSFLEKEDGIIFSHTLPEKEIPTYYLTDKSYHGVCDHCNQKRNRKSAGGREASGPSFAKS
jgi:hypothetical protein